MDVVTLALARKYADKIAATLAGGLKYKGSVNTVSDLPAASSLNKGHMYTIVSNGHEYVSDGTQWINLSADLENKQDKLNETQLAAVNSAITAAKVAAYDAYSTSKQNALTSDQLSACNSGITSTRVVKYENYETSIYNKVDKELNNTNGKAQILNESDGGGIFYVRDSGDRKSFVGVNDSTAGGPDAQIYAIDPSNSNYGAKLDILKDGIYYTVGSDGYAARIIDDNKLITKKDIANKQDTISDLATIRSGAALGTTAIQEHQSLAEYRKSADQDIIDNKKVDKEITGTSGTAYIFNESDGGGAKFVHTDGIESFVGVNNGGSNGIVAQIYADKYVDGAWQGAKLDITNTGIYYTVGNKSAAERDVEENKLVTKKDIVKYTVTLDI